MTYKAVYNDGTEFNYSEDEQGTGAFYNIDQSKLKFFELYFDGSLLHRLHFESNQKLILARRTHRSLTKVLEIRYLVGIQENIDGRSRQAIIVFFEDGHSELISKWKEGMMSETIIK